MSDFKPAFNARFRIRENTNRKGDKSPEKNIVVDFTSEEAVKAASYLMTMAELAELDRKTIRVYSGKEEFTEVTGFSLWGGLWGDKGSFAPIKPETPTVPPF
jgi:hypothetical protein